MEVKTWILATILFSGAFAILVLMASDAVDNYGMDNVINSEIEGRYNRLEESKALTDSFSESVQNPEGLTLIGGIRTLFTATIGVANAAFSSLTIIPDLTYNFAEDFGIDSSVTNLFFSIATILITTALIFAILNAGSGGRV